MITDSIGKNIPDPSGIHLEYAHLFILLTLWRAC